MDRIPDFSLWVGNARDAMDLEGLAERGIRALVLLAIEVMPVIPARDLIVLRFPIDDGSSNEGGLLELAIASVARLLREGVPTLVTCAAGCSRAPAIAAAALALAGPMAPGAALAAIAQARRIDVSPGLWNAVEGILETLDL